MASSRGILAAGVLSVTLVGCGALVAQAQNRVDYLTQVKPVLTARCIACHGVLQQNGNLRLDTVAFARKGGSSGPAVLAGKPDGSPLLKRVLAPEHGGRMPPEGEPLKPEEIAAIRGWIAQNAVAPANEAPERDPRDHWSFRPVKRPALPKVKNAAWVRNPVDAFIAQRHEQKGLKPAQEAPRAVLIRRLYVDLTGLPPSPEDLARLDADRASGWYERLVDRLLADPRHGERWARHWLDIWRYSDWYGLGDQLRNSQTHIWHWRDWTVEAVNADMPYDEMVRQMLAADEFYPNDLKRLRATGFLARNWYLFNRNQWLEETVEHVGKGFLGLTFNCAKCHDHKYDPIKQADFYKLRAFFEPYQVRVDALPGEPSIAANGVPRAFDAQTVDPTYLFIRGQETQPDKSTPLAPGVPKLLAFKPLKVAPVQLPVEAWQPERRPWVLESALDLARRRAASARDAWEKARGGADPAAARIPELNAQAASADLARIERIGAAQRAAWAKLDAGREDAALAKAEAEARIAAVKAERDLAAAKARLAAAEAEERLAKASADQKPTREKELAAAKAALKAATDKQAAPVADSERYTPISGALWTPTRFKFSGTDDPPVAFGPQSTGRRTALADWITDRRNPLTARVAVNHLWTRHMGTPFAGVTFDLGRKGAAPTHPELLDWLSAEFMEKGWSMRRIHRLIVTSAAYRMSSSQLGSEGNRAKDPDNIQLWRREPIRLEAEVIRDSILALAGTLDEKRGGPPVQAADQSASKRRSLYFFHSDNDRNLFLTTFDGPAVRECYRREGSIVPQQALALTNSELVMGAASAIAARLLETRPGDPPMDDEAFIRRAFQLLLGSVATDAEVAASRRALDQWRSQTADGLERNHLVWALLNHNDFVTLR